MKISPYHYRYNQIMHSLFTTIAIALATIPLSACVPSIAHASPKKPREQSLAWLQSIRAGVNKARIDGKIYVGHIDFDGATLGPEHFKRLTVFPKLSKLTFDKCRLVGNGIRELAPLKELTYVNLMHTPIGPKDIEVFQVFPKLETVRILYTPLDEPSLRMLGRLRQVSTMRQKMRQKDRHNRMAWR